MEFPPRYKICFLLTETSNCDDTALKTMRLVEGYAEALLGERRPAGDTFMIPITADNPLYLRQMKHIHNAPPGEGNVKFGNLIPQIGLMQTSMAMFDVAKTIFFDSMFDGLMDCTGLSIGTQRRFREAKIFKI